MCVLCVYVCVYVGGEWSCDLLERSSWSSVGNRLSSDAKLDHNEEEI